MAASTANNFNLRRTAVEHAVDDQRVALDLRPVLRVGIPRVEGPRGPERLHIARRDLAEVGVMRGTGIPEVGIPVASGGGMGSRDGDASERGSKCAGEGNGEGAQWTWRARTLASRTHSGQRGLEEGSAAGAANHTIGLVKCIR